MACSRDSRPRRRSAASLQSSSPSLSRKTIASPARSQMALSFFSLELSLRSSAVVMVIGASGRALLSKDVADRLAIGDDRIADVSNALQRSFARFCVTRRASVGNDNRNIAKVGSVADRGLDTDFGCHA